MSAKFRVKEISFTISNLYTMKKLFLPLYSWDNGAFIMVGVFTLVIIGLLAAIYFMMNSKNKKND